MRDVAAFVVIGTFFLVLAISAIMFVDDSSRWLTYRSPNTDICYEVRVDAAFFSVSRTMSPVDDSFCEDK